MAEPQPRPLTTSERRPRTIGGKCPRRRSCSRIALGELLPFPCERERFAEDAGCDARVVGGLLALVAPMVVGAGKCAVRR